MQSIKSQVTEILEVQRSAGTGSVWMWHLGYTKLPYKHWRGIYKSFVVTLWLCLLERSQSDTFNQKSLQKKLQKLQSSPIKEEAFWLCVDIFQQEMHQSFSCGLRWVILSRVEDTLWLKVHNSSEAIVLKIWCSHVSNVCNSEDWLRLLWLRSARFIVKIKTWRLTIRDLNECKSNAHKGHGLLGYILLSVEEG